MLTVCEDEGILNQMKQPRSLPDIQFDYYQGVKDKLDVFLFICTKKSELVLIDGDFLKDEAIALIRAIKIINNELSVIFVTSDNSLHLGRQVNELGIQYYAIKPLADGEIIQAVEALSNRHIRKS